MSTGSRIPLADARKIAEDFARLFDGTWDKWVIAGSVRRQKPDVGDIEHVCIPKLEAVRVPVKGTESLFGGPPETRVEVVNRLWQRADELLLCGEIAKALYGETQTTRWGDKLRGVVWKGIKHEIFSADRDNWGCILTIRTVPAEFSKAMVTKLNIDQVYRQHEGYLRYVGSAGDGRIKPCPDEETFFAAVGWEYRAPEKRR